MKKLTEPQKAYIAGIVDGEGCVRLQKKPNSYMAFVIVTNVKESLLYYLKETTGSGCVYKYEKAYKENWNPVHRWQVCAKQARELLRAIMPYLQIKKEVAELVLSSPICRGRLDHIPMQKEVFDKISILNHRGRILPTNLVGVKSL